MTRFCLVTALVVGWSAAVAADTPVNEPPPAATRKTVVLAADVFFDTDRTELPAVARTKLDRLVQQLQSFDLRVVRIIGHADAVASDPHNFRLSAARTVAVRRYLIDKGVSEAHVQIDARGKAEPVADNLTDSGRSQNRRVEIEVIGVR